MHDILVALVASPWLYAALFAATLLDGLLPPIPSETLLVGAAALAASTGGPSVLALCAVAAAGAVVGDNAVFALGRAVGVSRFRWMRRPCVAAGLARTTRALERAGTGLVLGARFVPVGRVLVSLSAGAVGFPRGRFLVLSLLGGSAWAAFSVTIGLTAGSFFRDRPLLGAAAGIVCALVLGFACDLLARFRRRRRRARDAAATLAP